MKNRAKTTSFSAETSPAEQYSNILSNAIINLTLEQPFGKIFSKLLTKGAPSLGRVVAVQRQQWQRNLDAQHFCFVRLPMHQQVLGGSHPSACSCTTFTPPTKKGGLIKDQMFHLS